MFNNINDNNQDYLYNSQLENQNKILNLAALRANAQKNLYGKSNPIKSFFKKLNFGSFVPEQLDFKQLDQTLDLLYTEREQLFYSDLSDKNRIFSHYF